MRMMDSLYISFFALLLIFASSLPARAGNITSLVRCDPDKNLVPGSHIEVSSAAGAPGTKYSYEALSDSDPDTPWATSLNVELPQWIKVTFEAPKALDTVILIVRDYPGLYANWKTVRIEFPDGEPVTAELEDRPDVHLIRFESRTAGWFKVVLTEDWGTKTYYGLEELLAFSDPDRHVRRRLTPRERWKEVKLEQKGREFHPCVNITPEDIERAKRNIGNHDWAREYVDAIIRAADGVLDKTPEWIRENCPEKGAAFAYGFTGCPICSGRWGTWGGAKCSFDKPGTVRCSNGHILPDADHPDPGTGYVAGDGRIHYFVGSYNAWVVETYQKWCDHLSFAYMITGEEKYAETCAFILDAIAEIYPYCDKGSWDYPSDPPSGRLCRPWYQVARVLVTLVDYYDRIHNSANLDKPSFVEGMTRRKNIEENMLKNGAWYCYERSLSGGMHNGEADYIRGALSVGCLLGIDDYVDWAVDGPYGIHAMIHNNSDRDGRYFESSLGYAIHARDLYLTFAEPLLNYRSGKYPEGLNLYDDASFRSFYVLPQLSMDCVGHDPRYGDSGPDTRQEYPPDKKYHWVDYGFAERIFTRSTDPEVKDSFGKLVNYFANGDVDKLRADSRLKGWLLFHADSLPETDGDLPEYLMRNIERSSVMGQKGIAILRTPNSKQAQACLLRYGPVLNHGHFDDLNINYYGLGYELTYDLGYGNGSTHTQVGWAKQTASHQLVLVDETRQQLDSKLDHSGGSLHLFADMPGMHVVDADANDVYKSRGVSLYRRFLALVGDGPDSYLLDIFNVDGGQQHDYMAHSLSTEISFAGVELGEREDGSVASPEYDWGQRQLNDGFISGVDQKPYLVLPPGNGLGFMMHPRRGTPQDDIWSSTWRLPDGNNYLRLTMLADKGTEIINAWAPGIYPHNPKSEHVIARRKSDNGKLRSTFVAIREPYVTPFIEDVEKLAAPERTTALAVRYVNGQTDRFIYAGTPAKETEAGDMKLDGCFGHARSRGDQITEAHVIGKSLSLPKFRLDLARGGYAGKIVRIDYEKNLVYVDTDLPADGRLNFQSVQFSNPEYSRNTAYTIHRIFRDGKLSVIDLGPQRIILGRGMLEDDPLNETEMTCLTQHEYARGLSRSSVGFFKGKMLVSDDWQRQTHISDVTYAQPFHISVKSTEGFEAGDTFYYLDLQAGDEFNVHNWAAVTFDESGKPSVEATDDAEIMVDGVKYGIKWSGR